MKTIAFFDAKPYEKECFDRLNAGRFAIRYLESKLNAQSAKLCAGCEVVCAFVNDEIDAAVIDILVQEGVELLAMRCAGYNNVDIRYAKDKLPVVRVPNYSPYAVAEHTMALLQTLNRRTHRAYIRTRDHNFSLDGLTGFDLHGKTIGLIGTGKIGQVFADICRGYGMNIIAYDPYPQTGVGLDYVPLDELFRTADIISLHCPLNDESYHIIDEEAIAKMKKGVYILNTSRGALIDSEALAAGLKSGKIGGAGLDVYEEESDLFFEDKSDKIIKDDLLVALISMPRVLVTSHQAFLTKEALDGIAATTLKNCEDYFAGHPLENEVTVRNI